MGTVNDVLGIASKEVGYSRWSDPAAGTKYGRWFAGLTHEPYYGENGVPYCAMFASWVLNQAGVSCAGFPGAYTPTMLAAARKSGATVQKSAAQAGDIVYYDWSGDGTPDHVGIVVANRGTYLVTIEGNTSRGDGGSQGNGGYVAKRTRSFDYVCGIVRPRYGQPVTHAGWQHDGRGWWYRRADGTYPAGGWCKIGGAWYAFDASGWMLSGWYKPSIGEWYWLGGPDDGAAHTGWAVVNGSWYYFAGVNERGYKECQMVADDWRKDHAGKDYWLSGDGSMATNRWVDHARYYVGPDGAWIKGK